MIRKSYTHRWYQNLQVQVLLLFTFLGGLLALTTKAVVSYQGERQFARNEQDQLLLHGDDLVKELGQSLGIVETTVRAMALLGARHEPGDGDIADLIPSLLDTGDSTMITGGGLWPEPYSFDPDRERASLFWGRDDDGSLVFYDDYNQPDVAPYFREEWYVPATYLDAGQVYWSRSYVDPYSHEPMATCTAPYFRHGRVAGVATVDITLAGLNSFLAAHCDHRDMYIFAVDHSNHFLDFPQREMIQPDPNQSAAVAQFITAADLARSQPVFRAMADTLDHLVGAEIQQQRLDQEKPLHRLTWELNQRIPGLAAGEAEIIAAKLLTTGRTRAPKPRIMEFGADLIFGEPSTAVVLPMPDTGWSIVEVTPSSFIRARVSRLVAGIRQPLLIALVIVVLLAGFSVRILFLGPMGHLVRVLRREPENLVEALNHVSNHHHNEIGELAGLLAHNTRDLRRARQQAEQVAQTKGNFLANMSHEIRTPLNGILGAANLLNEPDDPLELEKIMIIRRSAESLLTILNDVLDYSKLEAGQFSIVERPFDLVEALESCRQLVASLATEKRLDLCLTNSLAPRCLVLGDENRLRQIVLNLLTNAIKFTNEGRVELILRQVTGPAEAAGKTVFCIEVRDTGPGIAPEDQAAVFQVYSQVDSAPTHQVGGTGLGLPISRELSRLMGGELTLDSEPGRGATFQLQLPLAPVADEPTSTADDQPQAQAPLDLDVLLVEDNPTNRLVARKFLDRLGCAVTVACDGVEAVAAASGHQFDAILMDLQMPRMDGLTATRKIRALAGSHARVPIIPLTANTMPEDRENCQRAGMNDFLAKPINSAELRETLARWATTALAES